MSNNELSYAPPRYLTVPIQPLPQTNLGILEHSGIPLGEQEVITDIPPDLSWMAEIQLFQTSFVYSVSDMPGKNLWSTNAHTLDDSALTPNNIKDGIPWNLIPFLGSKWWDGQVSFKFIAIKPPRCTGKIMVRYSFDPQFDPDNDPEKRGIAQEWDLGQSGEFEFDITAVNPVRARPTWLPRITENDYTPAGQKEAFAIQRMPIPSWHMGSLVMEAAQRYQPGSIFPDSTRILVFKVYKNANFYLPTDFRGAMPHILCWGAESYNIPTPKV